VSVSDAGTSAARHGGDAGVVLYDVTETGVAVVTFNRPEQMNAWGGGMSSAFYAAVDQAESDGMVRAIVITGRGRAFCAGADMGSLSTIGSAGARNSSANLDADKLAGERHPHFLTSLRKPVIAAINGACAGYGLTQALMCDVRFAAVGAKFTTSFARRGLIAEYGISWILPRVIGWGAAVDLLLSGRVFYAEEAAELGLVNKVVAQAELLPHAMAYAEDLATHCSPSSMAIIKRQLYEGARSDLSEASTQAEKLMGESVQRTDFIEGVASFFERRPPNFPPLNEGRLRQEG
jgi:enoyl-CoA hydratase/carnithine racemase